MHHHAETPQRNVRALLTHTLARPTIKALTLTQPWATLLASGAKRSAPASGLAVALSVGKVIAIALLDALHPTERLRAGLSEQERAFGNYQDGRFAWHFAVVSRLVTPVVARGSSGLWEWVIPDACRQELEAEVSRCEQQEFPERVGTQQRHHQAHPVQEDGKHASRGLERGRRR